MAWPRSAISLASAGQARTYLPIRKKVAFALWRSNRSRSFGVTLGFGPSSNVMAIEDESLTRRIVGPNSCDHGAAAPHANALLAAHTPPAANHPGSISIAR